MVSRRTNRHLAQKTGRRGAAFFFFLWELFQERRVCVNRGEGYRTRNEMCAASTVPSFPSSKREEVLVTSAGPGSGALLTHASRQRAQG